MLSKANWLFALRWGQRWFFLLGVLLGYPWIDTIMRGIPVTFTLNGRRQSDAQSGIEWRVDQARHDATSQEQHRSSAVEHQRHHQHRDDGGTDSLRWDHQCGCHGRPDGSDRSLEASNPAVKKWLRPSSTKRPITAPKNAADYLRNLRIDLILLLPYSPNLSLIKLHWKFLKKVIDIFSQLKMAWVEFVLISMVFANSHVECSTKISRSSVI